MSVPRHVHDLQLLRDVDNDLKARHKVRVLPRDVLAEALPALGDDHRRQHRGAPGAAATTAARQPPQRGVVDDVNAGGHRVRELRGGYCGLLAVEGVWPKVEFNGVLGVARAVRHKRDHALAAAPPLQRPLQPA